ncbi:ras-related protein RABF1 [Cyclospora cayetanensis]|nr:ras-related protein RABF1 [Cyclospora cayetanensis]
MGCGFSSAHSAQGDPQLKVQNATQGTSSSRLSLEGKIVLLGDSGVGKSSLALRFCRGRFPLYHEVTIGAAFLQQTVRLDQGNQLKLHIWDTGGQERFRAMAPLYYRDAAGAVVVYDITAPSSLEAVKFWTKELRQHLDYCSITVAANKYDLLEVSAEGGLEEQQQHHEPTTLPAAAAVENEQDRNDLVEIMRGVEEVKKYCSANRFEFIECSAKTGQNVNRLFEDLARNVFAHLKDAAAVVDL